MVTINNRTKEIDEQIAALLAQMEVLNAGYLRLNGLKREPFPWLQETVLRLVLTETAVMKIMLTNKALIDSIYSSESITAEIDGNTTFVYLDFLNPEDEVMIVECGGVIEYR